MPIVDDPFDFGAIAATNAISDVYAMGGEPIMAISILGWPIDKIPANDAKEVISGARSVCSKAAMVLAGGHSIDAPEPIFGLAVTGRANRNQIKTNDKARVGSRLFLTKPLGIGILTTAQKKGLLKDVDLNTAKEWMLTLNKIGRDLGKLDVVTALTDVTGFGLLGHLIEVCEGSGVSAEIAFDSIPIIPTLDYYISEKCIPGGTNRNFDSYGQKVSALSDKEKSILCDPQTSGGLLVAVDPTGIEEVNRIFNAYGLDLQSFGEITPASEYAVEVK
jgi:selenide,water dikinase